MFATFRNLGLCLLVATLATPGRAAEPRATLKVVRPARYVAIALTVYVVLNGKDVGGVGNNETKTFEISPQAGKNTVHLRMTDALGFVSKSNEVSLDIPAGATVTATNSEITLGLLRATLGLTATVDRPAVASAAGGKATIQSVEVAEAVVDREIFTEPLEIVEGVIAEYRLERTYERTLHATTTAGAEAGVKVKAGALFGSAELSAEVKTRVEASLGITLGKKETFEQKITVDGNKTPRLKVIWVERYRRGTVCLSDGRKETFQVCVGLRWKLKKG